MTRTEDPFALEVSAPARFRFTDVEGVLREQAELWGPPPPEDEHESEPDACDFCGEIDCCCFDFVPDREREPAL